MQTRSNAIHHGNNELLNLDMTFVTFETDNRHGLRFQEDIAAPVCCVNLFSGKITGTLWGRTNQYKSSRHCYVAMAERASA